MKMWKKLLAILLLSISYINLSWASPQFTVKNIEFQGLQRISHSTVMSYLPVRAGDKITPANTSKIIKALYGTDFFDSVNLLQQGNTLIIAVVERPIIGALRISGNKKIKTNDLTEALNKAGFVAGQTFNQSVLTGIKNALLQQYYNLSHYAAKVEANTTKAPRNRVLVDIKIIEGPVAKIKAIRIAGNQHFTTKKLLKNFSLTTSGLLTWFTSSDQYSEEKLALDLDKLHNFYLDHGFLQAKIVSHKATLTPDKTRVYIDITVAEGPIYTIKNFTLSGNLLEQQAALTKLVTLKPGEIFSRAKIIDTAQQMMQHFANRGFAFAKINPIPAIDDNNHQVAINFNIDPGERVYVRQISFIGNTKTKDDVLRRETRQLEAGLYNLDDIKESVRRLSTLGFLRNVTPNVIPVQGHPNQVDLQYSVKEVSSATAGAQIGYSDAYKFLYGFHISETNFLGTGKAIGLQFNHSRYSKVYSFNYFDPYFTTSGIGLGFKVYANTTDPKALNLSSYSSDNYGGTINFSYPTSEYSNVDLNLGYEHTILHISPYTYIDPITKKSVTEFDPVIKKFVDKFGNTFDIFTLGAGWNYSSLNQFPFPTKGLTQSLAAEIGLPIAKKSLSYYKTSYDIIGYQPLNNYFIATAHGFIGYGNGYGKNQGELPFFKNYFAGGIGSVRGFEFGTLGPLDVGGNPRGGNISINGSIGLILPNPFGENVRTTAFVDAGNIYANQLKLNDLRYSAGLEVEWRLPFMPNAPLVFSFAKPINRHSKDQTTFFQFSFGAGF